MLLSKAVISLGILCSILSLIVALPLMEDQESAIVDKKQYVIVANYH
jgi:hypothetical protein